jgi:hypothetical protein
MRRRRVSAQLGDNRGVHEGMRTTTIGVACVKVLAQTLADRGQWLVRDEEVVGSNPATPTEKVKLNGLLADLGGQAVDRLTLV